MRILFSILVGCAILPTVQGQQKDWPVYGHDAGGMRYSPLKQINTKNVAKLQLAWSFDTEAPVTQAPLPGGGRQGLGGAGGGAAAAGAPGGRGGRAPRKRGSESTPLVIGGIMYMGTGYNRVLAIEPETGKKIWEYEGQHNLALRGIAYWPGNQQLPPQIVAGTADGWLIALNAKTGKLVPGFGNEGMVNLHQGFPDKFANSYYGLSSPPTIYKDLAITGAHTQENPSLGPPGDIRAWDMKTGKLNWTFHTIPRPGEANHDVWQEDQWADRSEPILGAS